MTFKSYGSFQEHSKYTKINNISSSTESASLYPSHKLIVEKTYCGVYRNNFLFFVLITIVLSWLLLGAAVFQYLEAPEEQNLINSLRQARREFLMKHPNVSDDALESLISEVVRASNRGVSAARNVSGEPNWSFGQSLFFSSTVITTIGYGHVTPLSRTGKIFCICYAIIGIPVTLLLLAGLVERLLIPTIRFLRFLNSRLGHLYQPLVIRLLHLSMMGLVLIVFFILIPAAVFATLEPDWDYLDSIYYCFISLTTIGLGDYIPGDSPDQPNRPFYKIATTGYLFMGITFMMLTLAVFYDIPQLNLGLFISPSSDLNSEKVHLAGSGLGSQYGAGNVFDPQYEENTHRHVVRVRSRRDDSPSPDEVTSKDLRLP